MASEQPFPLGAHVGGYELQSLISDKGGMGLVYKAKQISLERTVALKLIRKELIRTPEWLVRFDHEIRALSHLNHPNIICIYDAGICDEYPFFAMEYIEGQDLGQVLAEGQIRIATACDYICQVARGLESAHAHGLVHRDLKPSNLLRAQVRPGEYLIKIVDFGVVKIHDHSSVFHEMRTGPRTRAGVIVGTTDYVAPETINNSAGATIVADIYSLGCVLFQILTGRLPFCGDDWYQRLVARLGGTAPPIRTLRPEVPAELEAVVAKMLAPRPDDRYQTPTDLIAVLRPIADEESSSSAKDPTGAITGSIRSDAHVEIFPRRDAATPDLLTALSRHSKLVFPGISQQQLRSYLDQVLKANPDTRLPWRSIEVYYARDDVGRTYEDDQYRKNICESRQEIAAFLLRNNRWLPDLNTIEFLQSSHYRTQTGALLGDHHGDHAKFTVAYFTSGLAPLLPESSLTVKLDLRQRESAIAAELSESLDETYRELKKDSISLGTFSPGRWDESAAAWAEFCQASQVQKQGMEMLAELAAFRDGETVLELGAGSGELSSILLAKIKQVSKGELTILDASPVMVEAAKVVLGRDVRYALCRVPTRAALEDIDINDKKWDTIVIHLALPAIAGNTAELTQLAYWCSSYLKPGGRVLLSAHNTVVRIETPKRYNVSQDSFRQAIQLTLKRAGIKAVYRQHFRRFTLADIENDFSAAGFHKEDRQTRSFPMTVQERCLMWKVPAILDRFVDVSTLGHFTPTLLIDETSKSADKFVEDARVIAYWIFRHR